MRNSKKREIPLCSSPQNGTRKKCVGDNNKPLPFALYTNMSQRKINIVLILLMLLIVSLASCRKEEQHGGDVERLQFSCDTMSFDTVFTQMGTTTRQFKVYNRGSEIVVLDEVTLEGGRASRFRLNVDGDTSLSAQDVRIDPGDSIFVFVRANINPNLATEPFLIEDAILFRKGNNERRIPLTAYGRNAVYHVPTDTIHYADGTYPIDNFGKPYAYSVIDCEHWQHDMPHVIVGYAVVDSRQTLHLREGDELYFCEDAVLWVYDSATLDARGTEGSPVLFTSVRHDGWYGQLPGQWGYIWLSAGSRNNVMMNTVVENAFVGILVDSCVNANPTLNIRNSQVRNHSLAGIIGQTSRIYGSNLLVVNCGQATVAMQYGGNYRFEGCTFADYWRYNARKTPCVVISNSWEVNGVEYVRPMQAQLTDCIIYGNRTDGELGLYLNYNGPASAVFTNCLVRGGEWDEDPKFIDPQGGDFHLMEDSPAWGIGYQYAQSVQEKH